MRIKRKIKRATKQYIIVATICLLVIGSAAISTALTITAQIREEYQNLLANAENELRSHQALAYVATEDIAVGDIINEDNVQSKMVYTSQAKEQFITEADFGKVALIHIPGGTQLFPGMLTENLSLPDVREMQYDVININTNIVNNDRIDVRIFFPNGEDYIVLSKKTIKGLAIDSPGCLLWLNEEEILRMSSAIVDAYLYSGAKLYTTKYIEPNLQEESKITYEPSVATLLLIQDNPNILETATNELSKQVRKAMENRLAASMNTDVKEINWELTPNESLKKEEIPEVLQPENKATYQDELTDREAELDYGP